MSFHVCLSDYIHKHRLTFHPRSFFFVCKWLLYNLLCKWLVHLTFQVLMDAGLLAGGDMTPEAALSKLSYVLAKKELTLDAQKKVICSIGFIFFGVDVNFSKKECHKSKNYFVLTSRWWLKTCEVRWVPTSKEPNCVWATAGSSRSLPSLWALAAKR